MYTATRQIGIDMGHRVTNHDSKCKNLHGHRYTIEATIGGDLIGSGSQEGMVMDFGFLKDEMMKVIDSHFDHGTCLWIKDPLVLDFMERDRLAAEATIVEKTGGLATWGKAGKLYLLDRVPTAENLARHWFGLLWRAIVRRPEADCARLIKVKVWETPNCFTEYSE